MTETLKTKHILNVTNFLRQYDNVGTKEAYNIALRQFFELIYKKSKKTLDERAEQYFEEDRDYRNDMLLLKERLRVYAPTTILMKLAPNRLFFEENGVTIPKRFYRNLSGRITEAISEEKVPTNEELKRIIEYMPVNGKTLALLLSSSGMRLSAR